MEHFYESIPGNSQDITGFYADCVKDAPDRGAWFVEVGAWKGRSAAFMAVEIANSGKAITFSVVDLWDGATHLREAKPHPYEPATAAEFAANMEPVGSFYEALLGDSAKSAEAFADARLSMVYIDADHSLDAVRKDVRAWWPKVQPGGILAGHDWNGEEYPGVVQAVTEFAAELGLPIENQGMTWLIRKP